MSRTNSNKSREQYNNNSININNNDNRHNNKNNSVVNVNKNNNNMQYINYLTIKNGCKILQTPSKQQLSPYLNPQNILTQNMRQVWLSHSIPASCIIDIHNMKQKPIYFNRVGFNCWHQYSSNPKLIQLQYTNDDQQSLDLYNVGDHSDSDSRPLSQLRWTMLSKIRLQLRQGWQHFRLPLLLTSNIKYLKLTIVENYSLSQVVNDNDDIHDDDKSVRVMEGKYNGGQSQYDDDDAQDDVGDNYMLSRNIKRSNNDHHHSQEKKKHQRRIHKYMQQQSNTYLNQMSIGFVVQDKSDIIQSRVQKIASSSLLLSNQTNNNKYKQNNNKININNNNSNNTNSNININNSRQRQKTFSQFRKTHHTTSTTNNNTTSIPVQYQKQIRKLSHKIKQLSEQNQLIKHTVQKQNTLIMRLQNAVDLLVQTVSKMQNQLHKRQNVNINYNKQSYQSSNKKNKLKKDKIKIYEQILPKQLSQHKKRVVNANIDQSQNSLSQYQGVMTANNRNNNYINNNNNISNNKKDDHNNSNKRSNKQERNRDQQSVENITNNNNKKNNNKNSTIRNSIQTPQTKQKTYIPMLQKLQQLIMLRDQKKNRLQLTNNSKKSSQLKSSMNRNNIRRGQWSSNVVVDDYRDDIDDDDQNGSYYSDDYSDNSDNNG